ncbi:hypothetical protein BDV38DRAFT_260655 [Aspergillus pseudotamarii]|uniref:Uncharacterized protein n=1 Tax=Aspergillus pseudotamarii TaxID=132259 RepID=A0A5N6SDB4_ASPPS|nr:uncharacterized protein BDV38DRAFT_260655 [Aspergillus pseudotamarii]KAE8132652.1 hypothetical protein BDV38DRAFT_260655 [Aspergillus pseudotamarii]
MKSRGGLISSLSYRGDQNHIRSNLPWDSTGVTIVTVALVPYLWMKPSSRHSAATYTSRDFICKAALELKEGKKSSLVPELRRLLSTA